MDSEHRHELKDNDLQEFLSNFGQWWAKHGNTTLIVITLTLLVVFGIRIYRNSVTTEHDAAWFDWANANSPASFKQVAVDHSNPTVQAMAYLSAGDMLLKEALRSTEAPATTPAPESAKGGMPAEAADESTDESIPDLGLDAPPAEPAADDALAQAQSLYTTVLNESKHSLFRINALLGLGAVAEAKRDWAVAAQRYEAAKEQADADDAYPSLAQKAAARLALLPQLERPVVFAPEPVYAPTDANLSPSGAITPPNFDTPTFTLPSTNLDSGAVQEEVVVEESQSSDASTTPPAATTPDTPAAPATDDAP